MLSSLFNFFNEKVLKGQSFNFKKISALELLKHNTEDDLWTVINNKVYDLTK